MRRIFNLSFSAGAPGLLALCVALVVSVFAVWFGALNQDEGWYLYAAQMVRAGRLPYHDFFFTQGPAMPFVYAALAPIWGPSSPLHGLLGGRVVTLAFGFLSMACAVALVRRLVVPARRLVAGVAVFALLGCNLYHLYFLTIPKTYALGSLFLMAGLLLIARGLDRSVGSFGRACSLFVGGLSLAFATGTRISLILVLPVVGFVLLFGFRRFRWSFLFFGLGGALGLFLTYGLFALDPSSLRGLLAAQSYHAARGGFDPFFALGSVSRLARGYAALGVALFAWFAMRRRSDAMEDVSSGAVDRAAVRALRTMLGVGFAVVFLLQLSAPFPYDDYQVPVMGMLTVLVASLFADRVREPVAGMWFVVLVSGMVSFASPLLQEWGTYAPDRFWSRKKEMTELAKLRRAGAAIEALDPGGRTLLTQDLYLAIETGRRVPPGWEMGPFSFFPDLPTDDAKALHVMNRELLEKTLTEAPCKVSAMSGYAFAIAVPTCARVPEAERARYFSLLARHYGPAGEIADFGQNATTLRLGLRKDSAEGSGR